MQSIKAHLLKIAVTDSTVFITGETGTGKELVAELIHRHSFGSAKPFVCVNCAALPDNLLESELFGHERGAFTGAIAAQQGKFEMAGGGTIFLDEIGEMNVYAQAKILRVIESKEIYRIGGRKNIPLNIRVIAATNQDPERLVAEEKFRKDLYFRLNVARIHLPPLRDRKEDIPLLLEHYVREMNRRFGRAVEGFTEETLACLLRYDWSGNVRELKNLCEAIFINLPPRMIAFADLPEPYQRRLRQAEGLPQSERDRLLSALFSTNWNVSKASQKLHWSRMTLYRKIAKYHINKTCKPEADTAQ
jgi:transcriptional regulator with PAS, ATPase and Fis domain